MKAHTEYIKTNAVKCANLEGYKAADIEYRIAVSELFELIFSWH